MEKQDSLRQAKVLLEQGDRAGARAILENLLALSPNDAQVWSLLLYTLDNPQEKLDCLVQTARLNPHDLAAKQKLKKYRAGAEFRDYKAAIYHLKDQMRKERKKEEQRNNQMMGCLSAVWSLFVYILERRPLF